MTWSESVMETSFAMLLAESLKATASSDVDLISNFDDVTYEPLVFQIAKRDALHVSGSQIHNDARR